MNRINEKLIADLNQIKTNINTLAEANLEKLEPEIEKSNQFINQISNLHEQIDQIKSELIEQVIFLDKKNFK